MHRKLADSGLAAISVDLDDPEDRETPEKVLKFLTKQKATFTNLIMSEKPDDWQKKLDIGGPPVVIVYDRAGKLVKKYDEGVKYDEVEKLVRELLEKK